MTFHAKKTPEPTEVNPSALDSLDSASKYQFRKAPTVSYRGRTRQWFHVTVCPFCGGKHGHGGGNGEVVFLGDRVADCGGGTYSLAAVDVERWADALGLPVHVLMSAFHECRAISAIDRRFGLRKGTTEAEMLMAIGVPA